MTVGIIEKTELEELMLELSDWQISSGGIERCYETSSWKSSLMVVNAIGYLAEAAWHHPELVVGYSSVKVTLTTHSAGGITQKDIALAKKIDDLVLWQPQDGVLQSPPVKYAVIRAD